MRFRGPLPSVLQTLPLLSSVQCCCPWVSVLLLFPCRLSAHFLWKLLDFPFSQKEGSPESPRHPTSTINTLDWHFLIRQFSRLGPHLRAPRGSSWRRVPKIVTCHHADLEWTLRLSKNSFCFPQILTPSGLWNSPGFIPWTPERGRQFPSLGDSRQGQSLSLCTR